MPWKELKKRNVVRIGAAYLIGTWLLIEILHIVFAEHGPDHTFFDNLYKFLAAGFVISVLLAWIFERTPAGVVLAKYVDTSPSFQWNRGKKLDKIAIYLLFLAFGLTVYNIYFTGHEPLTTLIRDLL